MSVEPRELVDPAFLAARGADADGEGEFVYVRADRQGEPKGIMHADLRASEEDGLLVQLDLRYDDAAAGGARHALELVDDAPRVDAWYTPAAHGGK